MNNAFTGYVKNFISKFELKYLTISEVYYFENLTQHTSKR
jgi:hypothetical protein